MTTLLTQPLTPRQQEVFQRIVNGRSLKEIATEMGLSVKTIDTHRAELMLRFRVHNKLDLLKIGVRLGLLDLRLEREKEAGVTEVPPFKSLHGFSQSSSVAQSAA